jgi:hypothetical protein
VAAGDWPLQAATALRQSFPCVLAEVIASSQTWTSRSSVSFDGGVAPHHQSPTSAMEPAGQDLGARMRSELTTVPLQSRPNASPFWIMLLLVWSRLDNWMIPFWQVGRLVGRAAAAFALAATIAADVPAFAQSAARGHVRCPNGGVDHGKFYCNVKPVATGPASAAP